MSNPDKKRLQDRIVKKVSDNILYKLDAFERMKNEFWQARERNNKNQINNCNPPRNINTGCHYAFEDFYYYCLEKWEKGELNE